MLFCKVFISVLGLAFDLTAVFLAATGLVGENFLNMPSMSIFLRSFWFSPFALAFEVGTEGAAGSSTSVYTAASAGAATSAVASTGAATSVVYSAAPTYY